MGLSIHYSGTIKHTGLVSKLVDEVKDICSTLQWNYDLFDDEMITGICFVPEKCEPLFFTFLKDGRLCSPILLRLEIDPATTISTKTQFAGIDAHKATIKLLKHLKANYFSEFELVDEGGYWENEDEKILQEQFSRYEFAFNAVCEALRNFETKPGEAAESLGDRLERFLRERLKKP
jgi:hypothetical protein